MTRIKYPVDFLERSILFYNMEKKHTADGASSPLNPFLAQEGIDLAKDKAATDKAVANHKLFSDTAKIAEDDTQDRDNLFKPAFGLLKNIIQFLKSFYKGNAKELGKWGVQVDEERMVYPPDFLRRSALFKRVYAKHLALGAASPLHPFLTINQIDFDALKTDVDAAIEKHDHMQQAKRDAEEQSALRNLDFKPVFSHLRAIGAFLKALYVGSSKKLGNWGYTVDDSPPKPYRKKRKVPAGGQNTIEHVITGTLFHNRGATDLIIYKGNTISDEGIAINAGEKAIIPEGYSTIFVVNQRSDEDGRCSAVYG